MSLESRPKEGKQQEIGKLAGRSLGACMPDNWSEQATDGDADFGIDYLVQVKDEADLIQFSFFLQLKGTGSPERLADGSAISFQFDVSTLNYYRNSEPAVMVALADLSAAARPKDCPVYYLWLDEDFLDSIKQRREANDKVSIRIPTNQIIHDSLDISDYYFARLLERDELKEFSRAVSKHSSDPITDIMAFREAIDEKPGLIDAVKDDSGTPWIVNPEGHNATLLKNIQEHLTANRISAAEQLIDSIEDPKELTNHEQAELCNLKALIAALNEEFGVSCELLYQAKELHGASRYLSGWIEAKLRAEELSNEKLEELLALLDPSEYRQCFVIAKCLFLMGKSDDAIDTVKKHHPDRKVSMLWMAISTGNQLLFDEIDSAIEVETLTLKERYTYYMFVARWKFNKATNEISSSQTYLPSKGMPGFDFELLRESLSCLEIAWEEAHKLGYPLDVFLLIDVSMLVYSVFHRSVELIPVLKELLEQRPQNNGVRISLAKIYFNSRNYQEAAKLLGQMKYDDPEGISLLISAKFDVGERNSALTLLIEKLDFLLEHKPQNYEGVLVTGALSARDLLEKDKEKLLLNQVRGLDNGTALLAIFEFISKARETPHNIKYHKAELFEVYKALGQSHQIAGQLFSNLDALDTEEAEWILELSEVIRQEREFFEDENIHLAQALTTLKRWPELEILADQVIERSQSSNLWSLFKYAALDEQGKTVEALAVLEAPIDHDSRSVERAERYVGLSMSLGLYEKAESKLRELLDNAVGSHEQMLAVLGTLIHIYSASEELHPKLVAAIERFGNLVDRENEQEEAQYLQYFLMLTNRADMDVQYLVPEFQERLASFTNNFPESRVLRLAQLPEADSGDAILSKMRELAGVSDERLVKWKRDRSLIREHKLPVPYSLIHLFLDNAQDIFSVWTWGLYSPSNQREYLIRGSKRLEDEACLNRLLSDGLPLYLEEASLLLLSELGILDTVCEVMSKVCISRQIYTNLSKQAHQVFGSIHSPMAKRIVDVLSRYLRSVELLGSLDVADRNYIEYSKKCLDSISDGFVCSDDVVFSDGFKEVVTDCQFINSLDIIDLLVSANVFSREEKVRLIEKLCGFPVYRPDLTISEITNSLYLNLLQADTPLMDSPFGAVFNRYFSVEESVEKSFQLLSRILAFLISNYDVSRHKLALQDLLNTLLVRFPTSGRARGLAAIFVMSCHQMPAKHEHELIPRSTSHVFLYELIREIFQLGCSEPNESYFFSEVSDVMLGLTAEGSSELYEKVLLSFMPYSKENDEFVAIYNQKAILMRQKQDSPLSKLL